MANGEGGRAPPAVKIASNYDLTTAHIAALQRPKFCGFSGLPIFCVTSISENSEKLATFHGIQTREHA